MASPPDPELDDLRREVDRLDDAMVDLLAERMRVVGAIARIKQPAATGLPAIRPGREASILRRLVARAGDRLPAGTLVRMWRELLAATTRAQAPLAIAAWVPPDQPELWDIARDQFGSLAQIQRAGSWSHALRLLADGGAQLVVLPLPDGARALVARPARHVDPPAADRVAAAVLPVGGLSRGQRRLRRRRDRAGAVRRRRQPPCGREPRPRSVARGCSTSWRQPISCRAGSRRSAIRRPAPPCT